MCSLLVMLPLRVMEAELPVDALWPSALWLSALRPSALDDCFVGLTQMPLLMVPCSSNSPADQMLLIDGSLLSPIQLQAQLQLLHVQIQVMSKGLLKQPWVCWLVQTQAEPAGIVPMPRCQMTTC